MVKIIAKGRVSCLSHGVFVPWYQISLKITSTLGIKRFAAREARLNFNPRFARYYYRSRYLRPYTKLCLACKKCIEFLRKREK